MTEELVFVVDDDESVRKAITRLLASAGHRVESFSRPTEFVARKPHDGPACLVLDLRMPEMTGLELQERLLAAGHLIPIVFVSGHGDIPTSVRAIRKGAIDFLQKPFDDEQLLGAVSEALRQDRAALGDRIELRRAIDRWRSLTPREREVFGLVARGLLNKQIAGRLGTAEKTVKAHRAKVMEKMAATSVAELVRMSDLLSESLGARTAFGGSQQQSDDEPAGTLVQ